MDLMNKIFNIKGIDYEECIKKAIQKTKLELKDLDEERMCFIYSSYLYQNLSEHHLLAHIIDTKDLGFSFSHRFVLVYDGINYYLLDLTYKQFLNKDAKFLKLLTNGYQKITNQEFNYYLKNVLPNEFVMSDLDNTFICPDKKR